MILYRKQSLFAKRDYEGLSEKEKEVLSEERKNLAKSLQKERRRVKGIYNDIEGTINKDFEKKYKGAVLGGKISDEDLGKLKESRDSRIKFSKEKMSKEYQQLLDSYKDKSKSVRDSIKEKVKNSVPKTSSSPSPSVSKDGEKKVLKALKSKKVIIPSAIIGATVVGSGIGYNRYNKYKSKKEIDNVRKSILGEKN